jgi:predicted CoA-binding protein
MSKTLVIGATDKPEKYAYKAVQLLLQHHHEVVALGRKEGEVLGVKILTGKPELSSIDTVTLYVGPDHQPDYYDYILSLKPRRVIFNPGTENPVFEARIQKQGGIEAIEACTLVMLTVGNY